MIKFTDHYVAARDDFSAHWMPKVGAAAYCVFIALQHWRDRDKESARFNMAWPGPSSLMAFTGLGKNTIHRSLLTLVGAGMIEPKFLDSRFGTTVYEFLADPEKAPPTHTQNGYATESHTQNGYASHTQNGVGGIPKMGTRRIPKMGTKRYPSKVTQESNPRKHTQGGVCDSNFLAFVSAYPTGHATDEAAILDQWRTIKPDADTVAAIMVGLEKWKACGQWNRGAIYKAHNFLRHRAWTKDPPPDPKEKPTDVANRVFPFPGKAKGVPHV